MTRNSLAALLKLVVCVHNSLHGTQNAAKYGEKPENFAEMNEKGAFRHS